MGDYLHVAQEATDLVCGGSNPYQDRYVEHLAELLDLDLDEPIRFAYIKREDVETYCFQELWGCYYDDKAYSIFPVLTHELAHAVTDRAGWKGTQVFREGIADVLGFNNNIDVERLPIREVIRNNERDPDSTYTTALFVRFLLEEHGLEKLAQFMRATDLDDDFATVSAAFEDALGVSIDSAFDAFSSYPTCSAWANQAAIVECGQEPLPWGPDGLETTVFLDCDDDSTVGPISDEIRSSRSLEVSVDGTYEITVSSTSAAASGVRLTHCGDCRTPIDEIVLAGSSRTVDLSAGRYFALFVTDVGQPAEVTLQLSTAP